MVVLLCQFSSTLLATLHQQLESQSWGTYTYGTSNGQRDRLRIRQYEIGDNGDNGCTGIVRRCVEDPLQELGKFVTPGRIKMRADRAQRYG